MKHEPIIMNRKDYLAEHKRLIGVLEGAKTAAAAKELAKQRKEVDIAMKKTMKPRVRPIVMNTSMMKVLGY